ncbi:hypothetical protein H4R33_001075 [Dimargaris cristalligena]|nr:hypothetical protein H4R33_001075 [Dimargaris cristalligena]
MVASVGDTSYIPEFNAKCVQLVLDINAELIQVCIEFQNRGWFQDPDFAVYQARLQSNLAYLANIADHYLKTSQPLAAHPDLQAGPAGTQSGRSEATTESSPAYSRGAPAGNRGSTASAMAQTLGSLDPQGEATQMLQAPNLADLPTPKTPAGRKLQALLTDAVHHFQAREKRALPAMLEHSRTAFEQLQPAPARVDPNEANLQSPTKSTAPGGSTAKPAATTAEDSRLTLPPTCRVIDPPLVESPATSSGAPAAGEPAPLATATPTETGNTPLILNFGSSSQATSTGGPAFDIQQFVPLPPFQTQNIQPQPSRPNFLVEQELKRQRILQMHLSAQANKPPVASPKVSQQGGSNVGTPISQMGSPAINSEPQQPSSATASPYPTSTSVSTPVSVSASGPGVIAPRPLSLGLSSPTVSAPIQSTAPPLGSHHTMVMSQAQAQAQIQAQALASGQPNLMNFSQAQQLYFHQMRMQQLQQGGMPMSNGMGISSGGNVNPALASMALMAANAGAGGMQSSGINPQMAMAMGMGMGMNLNMLSSGANYNLNPQAGVNLGLGMGGTSNAAVNPALSMPMNLNNMGTQINRHPGMSAGHPAGANSHSHSHPMGGGYTSQQGGINPNFPMAMFGGGNSPTSLPLNMNPMMSMNMMNGMMNPGASNVNNMSNLNNPNSGGSTPGSKGN